MTGAWGYSANAPLARHLLIRRATADNVSTRGTGYPGGLSWIKLRNRFETLFPEMAVKTEGAAHASLSHCLKAETVDVTQFLA